MVSQKVKGIGFDATCSLVVVGEEDCPVPVGKEAKDCSAGPVEKEADNENEFNIIMWMDHRAQASYTSFIRNL